MGVTTTADEHVMSAREHISEAIKDLYVVLDPDTWGTGEYRSERIEYFEKLLIQLLKVKREL